MNSAIAFPLERDDVNDHAQARLDLPAPRIWTPKHLAEFLGVSVHWVYKRTEAAAEDPIPRVLGGGPFALRYARAGLSGMDAAAAWLCH